MTWRTMAATMRVRSKRRARGVTTVEYIVLVVAVFIPSVVVATTCFVHLVGWYAEFVSAMSQPKP